MTGPRVPGLPGHLLVDEAARPADCTICGTSVACPSGRFGPVSATDMLAAFVVGHATHDRAGRPDGLTPGGKPRKAAVATLKAAMQREEET